MGDGRYRNAKTSSDPPNTLRANAARFSELRKYRRFNGQFLKSNGNVDSFLPVSLWTSSGEQQMKSTIANIANVSDVDVRVACGYGGGFPTDRRMPNFQMLSAAVEGVAHYRNVSPQQRKSISLQKGDLER